jgi:hypothetical protein
MAQQRIKEVPPVRVQFKTVTLNPDGSIGGVEIGPQDSPIYLTKAQALVLAEEIIYRLRA